MPSKFLDLVPCVISWMGLILLIVGVATPEWSIIGSSEHLTTVGLWKSCYGKDCIDIPNSSDNGGTILDSIRACEAFGILSVLAGAACCFPLTAFSGLSILNKSPSFIILLSVRAAGVATAVFVIITTAVWGAKFQQDIPNFKFGYSFTLTVVGGVHMVFATILSLFMQRE